MNIFHRKQSEFVYIQVFFILLACFFSQGHFHFDEHFQILEFLNFKLGHISSSELPWEFSAQVRPWAQVFIYFVISKFLSFFGMIDPFTLPIFFRFITAILAITALFLTVTIVQRNANARDTKGLLFASVLTLWFWPFLSARISAECFNGLLFYNGVLLFLLKKNSSWFVRFLIFFVMLSATWGRVQLAPALLGFCLWSHLIDRSLQRNFLVGFAAFAIAILVNLGVDFWGYDCLTLTPWNYFSQNLLSHRASSFGVSPWYSYFFWMISKSGNPIGGLCVLIAMFFLWVKRPTSVLTWITVPFMVLHLFIGHKELRFLFPMVFFVPLILVEFFAPFLERKYVRLFIHIFIFLNVSIGLFMALRPANALIPIYKTMAKQKLPADKLFYFGGENPLRPGDLPMHWYLSKNIQTTPIESATEISKTDHSWVFTDRQFRWNELEQRHGCKRLTKSYFEFLYPIVPDKIMSKTRIFDLWECQVVGT